jgi:hypothetical protein
MEDRAKAERRKDVGTILVIVSVGVGLTPFTQFSGFESLVAAVLFFLIILSSVGVWMIGSVTRWYFNTWHQDHVVRDEDEE